MHQVAVPQDISFTVLIGSAGHGLLCVSVLRFVAGHIHAVRSNHGAYPDRSACVSVAHTTHRFLDETMKLRGVITDEDVERCHRAAGVECARLARTRRSS